MYRSFYHLSAEPFRLTPDPRFCFPSQSYNKAWAYMRYALQEGEGIVVVTGRSGTGKTTLVEGLVGELTPAKTVTARFAAHEFKATDLLRTVAYAFGLAVEQLDKATLLHRIEQFLIHHQSSDRRVLLIVDEAQRLPRQALEELRLLADLQSGTRPLLQIFLLGQEQLRDVLCTRDMEQLQQRVIAACHLKPMDLGETRDYIEHRLRRAGWKGDPELSGQAVLSVYRYSEGLPRHINKICNRLLLYGGTEERHRLDEEDVLSAIAELRDELLAPLRSNEDASHPSEPMLTEQVGAFGSIADLSLTAPAPDADTAVDVSPLRRGYTPTSDGHEGGPPTVATPSWPVHADAGADEGGSDSAPASHREYRYTPRYPRRRKLGPAVAAFVRTGYHGGAERARALQQWSATRLSVPMQRLGFRAPAGPRKLLQQARRWCNALGLLSVLRRLDGKCMRTGARRFDPSSKIPMALGMLVVATLAVAALKIGGERAPDDSMLGLAAEQMAPDGAPTPYPGQVLFPSQADDAGGVTLLVETEWGPSASSVPILVDPGADASQVADSADAVAPPAGRSASGPEPVVDAAKNTESTVGTQDSLAHTALLPRNDIAVDDATGEVRATIVPADQDGFPDPSLDEVIAATQAAVLASSQGDTWAGVLQAEQAPDVPAQELVIGDAGDAALESVSFAAISNATEVVQSRPVATATKQPKARVLPPSPVVSAVAVDELERAPVGQVAEVSTSSQSDRIAELLTLADQSLQRDRLLVPANKNAFYYYQRVLGLDSGNSAAEQGLDRIVARYVELAQDAIGGRDYDAAQRFIRRGLRVRPRHTSLLAMRESVSAAAAVERAEVVVEPDDPVSMPEVDDQPEPQGLMNQLKRLFEEGGEQPQAN